MFESFHITVPQCLIFLLMLIWPMPVKMYDIAVNVKGVVWCTRRPTCTHWERKESLDHTRVCSGPITHLSSFQCWGWGFGTWSQGPLRSCEARPERYTRLSTCSTEACRTWRVTDLQRDRLGDGEKEVRQVEDKMRRMERGKQWRRRVNTWCCGKQRECVTLSITYFTCCVHNGNNRKCTV